jgi:DNA replication protein DnaC
MTDDTSPHLNRLRPDFMAIAEEAMQQGGVVSPEQRAKEAARDARHARRGRLERTKPAIMPEDFEAIMEDRLAPTPALEWVQQLRRYRLRRREMMASGGGAPVSRPMNILALCGDTGRGKTVASAWLLAEEGGVYVTADELRRKVVSPGWRERDWFEGFVAASVLIVDDIGTELDPAGANLALFEVVNRRVSMAGAYTLLTTNLTESEFRARYDPRTIRRIEHAGAIVTVGGPDLRRGQP